MFPDTVDTLRLHLRRPVPTDAERIFQTYAQDREVARYLEWVPHTSVETTKKFIAFCQDRWTNSVAFPYVITRKEDGELPGMIEVRSKGHRADFGYVLGRAFWGNGLMPEAIAAVVKITLGHPTIYRMAATCDVENKASARALEKSGFTREGLLRRYIIHRIFPLSLVTPCFMRSRNNLRPNSASLADAFFSALHAVYGAPNPGH